MRDDDVQATLRRHWTASDANDFATEHQIYRDDAILDYPQSGERIRGRHNIQASRTAQPNTKHFTVRRMVGEGDLWITELVMTYDSKPIIGRCPTLRNVIIAAGHNMLGLSMAPATGKLVVEILGESTPHIDPEPFAVTRFL